MWKCAGLSILSKISDKSNYIGRNTFLIGEVVKLICDQKKSFFCGSVNVNCLKTWKFQIHRDPDDFYLSTANRCRPPKLNNLKVDRVHRAHYLAQDSKPSTALRSCAQALHNHI